MSVQAIVKAQLRKSKKGSVTLEMLANLPILLMVLIFIIESGFIMYDWAVINYATASAAVNAASNGGFSEDIRNQLITYVARWTSQGKDLAFQSAIGRPLSKTDVVVVWGTDPEAQIQRGDTLEVGVYYPLKFKVFIIDALSQWVVGQKELALQAYATAPSEVFVEELGG